MSKDIYERNKMPPRTYKKLPRTVKVSKTQSGRTTIKRDSSRKAMTPGKRLSKNRRTYYEKRKNRSDKDRRKRL